MHRTVRSERAQDMIAADAVPPVGRKGHAVREKEDLAPGCRCAGCRAHPRPRAIHGPIRLAIPSGSFRHSPTCSRYLGLSGLMSRGGAPAVRPKDVIAGVIKKQGNTQIEGGNRITLLRDALGSAVREAARGGEAPAFIAATDIGTSPWPVIRITGSAAIVAAADSTAQY